MTQATSGTATSMTAPATAGTYYIYVIDQAGNVSSASSAALTVGNAGFTLSATTSTVTEAGGTATFTLVLDSRPDSNVVISVASGDTGEVTVSAATLTFTEGNWNSAQTVTLTGVDDNLIDVDTQTTVTMAVVDNDSDDNFDGVANQTVTVTTTDNDTAGFTLSATTATVTEAAGGGNTATYTVVLDAQPDSDVVISVTSGDTGEVTVSAATLTFTNANWSNAQTVTLTGVDDNLIDVDTQTTVTMAVVDNDSDDNFDGVANQTVTVTTTDNDTAAFTLGAISGTVTEAGSTATFTVVLGAQPDSDVVISVTSGDTGEATVSPATLTFTNGNWNSTQTVTVTGVDDNIIDGNINTTITMAVVDNDSDDNFDALADQTVTATTVDDDTAGFTLSTTTATVAETGTTATFTVVLDAEPSSNVVISVTSGDTGEATVSAANLTFTTANWDSAQTVTVTGVDDNIIDGNINTTITMAVVDASSDDNFDDVANQTVTATTTDDDSASFTLGAISGTVSEGATTATFTVVLGAQPDSDVVISVTSGDTGEATVSAENLTFTNGNWNTPQTVTVTGVDDNLVDGSVNTTITMAVVDASSDNNFDALADQTVTVTTTDDDSASFTLGAISGTVSEGATTATFTVVLGAQPDSDVVISVTSGDTGEATVSAENLTFTNGNWNTPQTVTVTGVDDNLVDGSVNTTITMAVVDNDSDNNFDALADQTVTVTTTDNDTAGFTLSATTATVTEAAGGGNTATYTVVLDAQPDSDVVISVTSGDTGEVTVSAATLTFTNANWSNAQTVTLTGVDDNLIDVDTQTTVTMAVVDNDSDDNFDGVANQTVTVTTTDNDTAAFTLGAISGTVTEAGSTATFTVVLGAQPDSDVVISVTSGDTGEATVSPATLTFTNGNWNSTQTVTVTGVDDNIIDGNINTTITMAVVDNDSDDSFDALADQTVTATTVDDDTAGFTLSTTTATVAETGTTATFTVVLDAQPSSNVVISVTSGDTGEATVSAANLTFTNANWDSAQTVTVTGVDDNIIDGNINTTITMAVVDASSDDNFDDVANQTVTATTTDDDSASFTLGAISGTVSEGATTATFTVVLGAQPDSDVVISVTSGDTGEATVSAENLTFTNGNWNTPQTVTVTGVDDNLVDGSVNTTITMAVVDNDSDDNFDALADQTVTVTTTDNDTAGFTLSATTATVTEAAGGGNTATYTVVLDAQPDSDVVISVTSGDTGEVTVSAATLTFTNANWSNAQTVTLTGVDDNLIDVDTQTTVTMAVVDNDSDDNFDGVANQTVTVTTTDNDTAAFTLGAISGTVTEAGSTATFTVVLGAQPDSDVVISVTSGDTGEATVSPATLTFTNGNWNSTQTVTVTGVDDNIIDGNINTTITMAVVDNDSDDNFDALADQTVTATTVDDDTAAFTLGAISGTVTEAGSTATFTVVLGAQPDSNVVISVTSGDTGEATVSPATLTFTNGNWNSTQTVTVTGVDDNIIDGNINTTITMAVVDNDSDDNFDALADQTVTATTVDDDTAGFTLSTTTATVAETGTTATFTVVLDAEPSSNVVISVTSGDTGEATVSAENLTFTTANWDSAQTVTVTGVDDTLADGSQSTTITMAVVDNDSDDNFDALADQTVTVTTTDNDTAGFTLSKTDAIVTNSGGTDTFTVVLDVQPVGNVVIDVASSNTDEVTVSATSLTFTTGNWDTPQTITVTGVNGATVSDSTTTTITMSVNDGSSEDNYDAVANQTVSTTFTIISAVTQISTPTNDATPSYVFTTNKTGTVTTNIAQGILSGGTVTSTGNNTVTFNTLPDGTYAGKTITFTDAANNAQSLTLTTFVVDTTAPTNQNTVFDTSSSAAAGDTITIVSSGDSTNQVWFAPAGTTSFSTGATMTQAASGTATSIAAPANEGTYYIYVIDQAGNVSSASTAALTVDNSAPSAFTTGSVTSVGGTVIANYWNSTNSSIKVTIPVANDSSLTGGTIQLEANVAGGGFETFGSAYTITGDDLGTSYEFSQTATVFEALSGGLSDSESVTFRAIITDLAGNSTTGTASGTTIAIDQTAPTVFYVTSSSSDGLYSTGDVLSILVFTSDNVTVTGTPQLTLETGGSDEVVDYSSGSGSSVLVFSYTVASGNNSSDLDYASTGALALNGGSINDSSGNPLTLTLATPGAANSLGANKDLVVDTAAPTNQDDVFPSAAFETVGGSVTIVSSGIASNQIWIAPAGTASFSASATMTQATSGTATSMTAPTTAGTYYIYVIDAAGNVSSASTAALTVGNAGFTLGAISGTVTEAGTTATFTAVLDSRPDSDVVISVTSGDTGEVTVSAATLTFTEANWNNAQTVTVTGVDDNIIDGNINTTITMAVVDNDSDDNFDALADQTVTATTVDNDTAAFTLGAISGTVTEAGSTATFTVVLGAQPDSDVVISVTSGDTGEATVSPATLTFTNGNWNSTQTVTVTGVDDNIIDGNINTTITMAVVDNDSDDNFDALADQTVTATTVDDDTAGFTLSTTTATVAETGTTATFTVVLDAEPSSNVVISVTSGDTGEATVSAANLTFTTANWDSAQTVTVTGVDDNLVDGSVNTTITMAVVDASSDDNFDGVANQTVTATTTDDDTAGFTLSATTATVTEAAGGGNTATYTVVLDAQPDSDVVISVTSGDTGEVTVSAATLTFTNGNWDTPQTVTLTGVDDNLIDVDTQTTVTMAVVDNDSDDNFDGVANQTVTVTTTDNDTAAFTLGAISGTVTEAGSTATFTVVLGAQPDSDVVISVTSGDTGEATVSPATLTFTNGNWNSTQTVTVTGVDDNIIDGNINTTITMAVVDNDSDDNFDALADQTVTATTVDDDTAAFTLGAISGTVTEAGSTATFTVVLGAQPDSNVVISVTSGDTGEATVSPATLTFTNGNWNSTQTVTVTGVDDNIIDGNINTTITMAVVDNDSDDNFDALADQTVTATTVDDDTAGFTLSTTTATVAETGTTATFTVVLDAEPSSNVVISVTSGDTGEATVSAANLTFTTANWDSAQTVTVTGVDDNIIDGNQLTLPSLWL